MTSIHQENHTSPSNLGRIVGRFVWIRGHTTPVHFMPLKEFHLDVALDASVIVALRTRRKTGVSELLDMIDIGNWMNRLAIDDLVRAVSPVLSLAPGRTVYEIGSVAGTLFEALKATRPEGLDVERYYGCGPKFAAHRFQVFHETDECECGWVDSDTVTERLAADPDAVLIVNHNQAIRHGHCAELDLLELVRRHQGPTVMALRMTPGDKGGQRVTVNGHVVTVPAQTEVLSSLTATGRNWGVRITHSFDPGLFIPDEYAPSGLILAVAAENLPVPTGFRRLDAEAL